MQIGQSQHIASGGIAVTLRTLVDQEGTNGRAYVHSPAMQDSRTSVRNLADAVHYLCVLHGRHPGVVDIAANLVLDPAARQWMAQAIEAFKEERSHLARLSVAVGPQPSTPGQAESEATVTAQRHALEILAKSDRDGCALGAALALALDWQAIRQVIDRASLRLGLSPRPTAFPSAAETMAFAEYYARTSGIERAMSFGAQQLLAQHRGLWNLLEARHLARGDY